MGKDMLKDHKTQITQTEKGLLSLKFSKNNAKHVK